MIPPILTIDGKLYRIIRPVREYPGMDAALLREFHGASHSFKKDGIMYYVDEIPDIEFEEKLNQKEEQI